MSRFAAFLLPFLIAAPAHAQVGYFAAIEDLPMPAGFVELASGGVFEAGGAQLTTTSAQGATSVGAVRSFYLSALPALGWSLSPGGDDLMFRRGRQVLTLRIIREQDQARVEVQLVETAAPAN